MKTPFIAAVILSANVAFAADLKVNDKAPVFSAPNQDGKTFDLNSRKGQWTVLYFYPKSGTPGCTKQACAFRDSIKKIHAQNAEVYGISADSIEAQKKFHSEHKLSFDLLADPDGKIIDLYGSKIAGRNMANRWTFIINPDLKIAAIDKDVDPLLDAQKVATKLGDLKKAK